MNRKERRNLQRQGVQVPKDPTLNIKLSALGKSIMTPEMRAAMMHEINQQCLEKDDLLALDVDCMVLWTLHRHLGFGVKRLHDFYLAMAAEHRRMRDFYEMDDLYPERLKLEGHEALDAKVNTLIKVLKFIIAESGFELAARIELRDRKTGRFFR